MMRQLQGAGTSATNRHLAARFVLQLNEKLAEVVGDGSSVHISGQ